MNEEHKVVIYDGKNWRFRNRWFCVCGDPMPDVAFGIPLERAFTEHLNKKAV